MTIAVRLLALFLGASTLAQARQAVGWTAAGVKNGVALAFRDVPALNAREVRAVAELPHPSDRIGALVCDFTQIVDPGTREARVLSGEINGRYEIYLRYAPRYLVVSARDVVIEVRRESHGCSWSEVDGRIAPPSGTVRMALLRGCWTVASIDESRSRVTYQVAVRPGGSIPGWLVRRGAVTALPDIIGRVDRCLSRPNAGHRCPRP